MGDFMNGKDFIYKLTLNQGFSVGIEMSSSHCLLSKVQVLLLIAIFYMELFRSRGGRRLCIY